MARKKALVPHFERGVAVRLKTSLMVDQKHALKVQYIETVNNNFAPPLITGWKTKITTIAGKAPNAEQLAAIEKITKTYIADRVARKVNPIEWQETIARIERIAKVSKSLLDELNDWRGGHGLIWEWLEQLSAISGLTPLTHDEVYPIISRLYSASIRAVEQAQSDKGKLGELSHTEPWCKLVNELSDLWTLAGGSVTAAKSGRGGAYAKPSPFVQLVQSVIQFAVPEALREHAQSEGATQAAVSNALSENRKASGRFPKKRIPNKSRHH